MKITDALYALIDTETSGVDSTLPECEVLEVAVDVYQGIDGTLVDRYSSLIAPVYAIPVETSAIHHLTPEDFVGAPTRAEVDAALAATIPAGAIRVAHNAPFDAGFLPAIGGDWLCTSRLAHHLLQGVEWQQGFGLTTLLYTFGFRLRDIDMTGLQAYRAVHSAPGDIRLLAPVLFHLIARYRAMVIEVVEQQTVDPDERAARIEKAEQVETLIAYANRPYTMTHWPRFGKHAGVAFSAIPRSYLDWYLENSSDTKDADLRWNCQREIERRSKA